MLLYLRSGRRSSSLSKRQGINNSRLVGSDNSDIAGSHSGGTAKPHTSTTVMSGQDSTENPDGGGARPRTDDSSQPPGAGRYNSSGLENSVLAFNLGKYLKNLPDICRMSTITNSPIFFTNYTITVAKINTTMENYSIKNLSCLAIDLKLCVYFRSFQTKPSNLCVKLCENMSLHIAIKKIIK